MQPAIRSLVVITAGYLAFGVSAAHAVDVNSAVQSSIHSAVHSAVNSAVHSAVHSSVNSAVHSSVNSAVRSSVPRPNISGHSKQSIGSSGPPTAVRQNNTQNFGSGGHKATASSNLQSTTGITPLTNNKTGATVKFTTSSLKALSTSSDTSYTLSLPNGQFATVTVNSNGSVTLTNNNGSVTLTMAQLKQVGAGNLSPVAALMGAPNIAPAKAAAPMAQASNSNNGPGTGNGGNNGTTYGNPPAKICPVQQCSSTVNEGPANSNGQGPNFYEVNFQYAGTTPPPPPPGMHYLASNMTGCGGGTCTLFLEFNSPTIASAPAVPTPAVSAGGRQPIYVQDANGVWHYSYWFAPPADVLENYGPLSEASSQPTLPYGFNYPNGPPPNAVYGDDVIGRNSNANDPTQQANANDPDTKSEASAQPAQVANQSPDGSPSDLGKTFTAGSWDDPSCVSGCYDPKYLNDLGIQPQYPDGTPAPPTSNPSTPLTLEQMQAQVDANTQKITSQMNADAALPTSPPSGQSNGFFSNPGVNVGFVGCDWVCAGVAGARGSGNQSNRTVYGIVGFGFGGGAFGGPSTNATQTLAKWSVTVGSATFNWDGAAFTPSYGVPGSTFAITYGFPLTP
jgi:hypothetical protein